MKTATPNSADGQALNAALNTAYTPILSETHNLKCNQTHSETHIEAHSGRNRSPRKEVCQSNQINSSKKFLLTLAIALLTLTSAPKNSQAKSDFGIIGFGAGLDLISRGSTDTNADGVGQKANASAGIRVDGIGEFQFTDLFGLGMWLSYHPVNLTGLRADLGISPSFTLGESAFALRVYQGAAYLEAKAPNSSGLAYEAGLGASITTPKAGYLHFRPEISYKVILGTETSHLFSLSLAYLFDL